MSNKPMIEFSVMLPLDIRDEIVEEARLNGWTNGQMARVMWTAYKWMTVGDDRVELARLAAAATEE